jgi:homoserine kinase type II
VQTPSPASPRCAGLLLRHLGGQRAYLERAEVRADTLDDLPYQVIHGDYTDANLFFADGAVCAIIDWENSAIAPRAWEILRVLHVVFDFDPARCQAFIIGYRQRQLLPLDELYRVAATYGVMRAHDLWLLTAIVGGNQRLRRFLHPAGFQPVAPRWAALRAQL